MRHIHILGVCGTFMAGVAKLAMEMGYRVSGCDANVYPPMSDQLRRMGIELHEGYLAHHLDKLKPDLCIIGNALSRGNPMVEAILNNQYPYTSGPQWVAENILKDRWVIAVSGTHGKTTTSSILAWILDQTDLHPGFLIGGIPENFGTSARLGSGNYFVIEADEYDTAFFDKRSKFVHYRPNTLILNNLEYDHADIFPNLEAIKLQFHHLIRTVSGNGLIICNGEDRDLHEVMDMGCWTAVENFAEEPDSNSQWTWRVDENNPYRFEILHKNKMDKSAWIQWPLIGRHNIQNATAAVAAANYLGVDIESSAAALSSFNSVKRRLEVISDTNDIKIYDDFAHHPTAVSETLVALVSANPGARILCILEPRSNTMRLGSHKKQLAISLKHADFSFVYQAKDLNWDLTELESESLVVMDSTQQIIDRVCQIAQPGDLIVIMSNGGFKNMSQRLAWNIKNLNHKDYDKLRKH